MTSTLGVAVLDVARLSAEVIPAKAQMVTTAPRSTADLHRRSAGRTPWPPSNTVTTTPPRRPATATKPRRIWRERAWRC